MAKNNELFCNYKAAPHNKALEDTVEAFQDSKTVATYTSSGHVPADRILEKLNSAKKIGKTTLVVVVHHPNLRQEKTWKQHLQPVWMQIFENTLSPELSIRFHEMPTTMSDGSKNLK